MNRPCLSQLPAFLLFCFLVPSLALAVEAPLMQVKLVPKTYNGGYHLTCNGGNDGFIETVVTDGIAPYTYVWNNGSTSQNLENVPAGTYSVTVTDAQGQNASASIEILQPKLLEVEASSKLQEGGTHVSNAGGSDGFVRAKGLGGTPPYTSDGTATVNGSVKDELYDL